MLGRPDVVMTEIGHDRRPCPTPAQAVGPRLASGAPAQTHPLSARVVGLADYSTRGTTRAVLDHQYLQLLNRLAPRRGQAGPQHLGPSVRRDDHRDTWLPVTAQAKQGAPQWS